MGVLFIFAYPSQFNGLYKQIADAENTHLTRPHECGHSIPRGFFPGRHNDRKIYRGMPP